MHINRTLNLLELLKKKSFFLFGPRATGKSSLIKAQLGDKALVIDLLKSNFYLSLLNHPEELEKIIQASKNKDKIIVIDEIQKVPQLLEEVHRLIEDKKYKFLLTGSSARKLKRGSANLLAGRAWQANLFPLTWLEITESKEAEFDIQKILRYGSMPAVYLSESPEEELQAYVKTYLYEEIQSEGLVRNISGFSRFLETAALSSCTILNFTKISSDSGVSASTVREYFQILEDTLVGFILPAWQKSKKRKAMSSAKFYFFDTGVTHTILGTKTLNRNSNLFGSSFEQFIASEIRAALSYQRSFDKLSYWNHRNSYEVDFVIGDEIGVEVKATKRVDKNDLKSLKILAEENIIKKFYLVSFDEVEKVEGDIEIIHWKSFLEKLWGEGL